MFGLRHEKKVTEADCEHAVEARRMMMMRMTE
jgi:hypothetical protein